MSENLDHISLNNDKLRMLLHVVNWDFLFVADIVKSLVISFNE
jgi:hypothetical protein